jgi:hypothetical protein
MDVNTTPPAKSLSLTSLGERRHRTPDGYTVEIAVPLQTIRFSGNHETMGILFWRHVSRSLSYSWPEMPPGQWVMARARGLSDPRRGGSSSLPSATLPARRRA